MLKITVHPHAGRTTLQLEGVIAGPWIDELRRQCQSAPPPVELDLAGVEFMDQRAAHIIETLVIQGARIVASSQFATLMLRPPPPGQEAPVIE